MSKRNVWVGEQQASELLGLKPATIKIYIKKGDLKVRRAKATYKAKSAYHLGDILTHLEQRLIA